jgi:histidinol-phosphate aminotransferase
MQTFSNMPERAVHGAIDYSELERLHLRQENILDFSVNSNPYGPSPRVRTALASVALDRYPDRECTQLREVILQTDLSTTPLSRDALVCGNGATELIWNIAHTYLKAGHKAAITGPTFGEYRTASLAAGAEVVEYSTSSDQDFQLDVGEVCRWLLDVRPTLVWLCNPNNPTGTYIERDAFMKLCTTCQHLGAMLVIDESYWHFVVPQGTCSALAYIEREMETPVLVLRSLTKDYALAGLRLGYIVAPPVVAQRLQAHLPAWNVSSVAQAAGCAALTDQEYLNETLGQLMDERLAFFDALTRHGIMHIPSRTHFCLIQVENAHDVRHRLLVKGLLVRDCASFGLPRFIRVATRQRHEWQQLVTALEETL